MFFDLGQAVGGDHLDHGGKAPVRAVPLVVMGPRLATSRLVAAPCFGPTAVLTSLDSPTKQDGGGTATPLAEWLGEQTQLN